MSLRNIEYRRHRYRQLAMLALNRSFTICQSRDNAIFDFQIPNENRRTDDVCQRIPCSNLVEMYLAHGAAVGTCFGFCNDGEDPQRESSGALRHFSASDDLLDVGEVAVVMMVVVALFMRLFVMVQVHIEVAAGNAVRIFP